MSIGKSSIHRLTQAAEQPQSGIRSLAPEVPAGDAATPFAAVTEELTAAPKEIAPAPEAKAPKKAPAKKAPVKKAPAKKAAAPTDAAPKKRGRKPKSEATTAPAKAATPKKAPAKKTTAQASVAKKPARTKDGFVSVAVGEALPYWLL